MTKDSVIINVENLVYTYPGAPSPAVSNVSFQVKKGEVFGLLGPSGAGKSTIQKVLTRQHRTVASGHVEVLGRDIRSWGQDYYEQVGVGFELPNHYLRMTARENLDFFASLYRSKTHPVETLLEMVGLSNAMDVRVSDFSKGMMMRLNFVRALLHNPDLIFLDEPTSGLDPVNAQRVKEIIRSLQEDGKTIVLTTHNMSDVDALCERVGFMVKGEMKILDHTSTLKARYGERVVRVAFNADGSTREVDFALDGLGENAAFLELIKSRDIDTLHTLEATLDKVFAEVTGTELDAETDTVAAE